jgi:tRNA-dihydrouridine synthase 3
VIDWRGQTVLAPLTKGGNLPFRRLCVEHGARITVGEMAYARQVVRRSKSELALLRSHKDEPCFGAQLAAGRPEDAVAAAQIAVERGARFLDLNAGCPIHDVVRRGMGATLLQRPAALARIVGALRAALPVPITVKIRSGWCAGDVNAPEVARLIEEAGASALTVHARTREQRYTKAADWDLIARIAAERRIPVIGNGDILTWYEASHRRATSGCAALMVARGALIKPWIFREIEQGIAFEPDAEARVAIYHRFTELLREHFRTDEKGRMRALQFLPWHFSFFCRYRPWPRERWEPSARAYPLLQTRQSPEPDLPLLERLLRDPRPDVHQRLAEELWASSDAADAVARFLQVAAQMPPVAAEAEEVAVSTG